jgi:transposase
MEVKMSQKKKWSSAAKFEIALLAIKGETTLNEICQRFGVAPSQVHAWKKQLLEQGAQLFIKSDKSAVTAAEFDRKERQLYQKIGQLTMERDFLKKSWSIYQEKYEEK